MAFKRSGVRSSLAPPVFIKVRFYEPFFIEKHFTQPQTLNYLCSQKRSFIQLFHIEEYFYSLGINTSKPAYENQKFIDFLLFIK